MGLRRQKMKNTRRSQKVLSTLIPLSFCYMPHVNAQTTLLPIAVSVTQDLHFGSFFTLGAAGDVIISTADVRTTAGGIETVVGAGLESRGQLAITASTGQIVTIEMTAPSFNLVNGDGDVLIVNDFQLDVPPAGSNITKTITASTSVINIGATLNVPISVPTGNYRGSYNISVVYQ